MLCAHSKQSYSMLILLLNHNCNPCSWGKNKLMFPSWWALHRPILYLTGITSSCKLQFIIYDGFLYLALSLHVFILFCIWIPISIWSKHIKHCFCPSCNYRKEHVYKSHVFHTKFEIKLRLTILRNLFSLNVSCAPKVGL